MLPIGGALTGSPYTFFSLFYRDMIFDIYYSNGNRSSATFAK